MTLLPFHSLLGAAPIEVLAHRARGSAEASIKQEVGAVAGVTGVDVDLESKDVVVTGSSLDRDALVAAIDEAGFDVA